MTIRRASGPRIQISIVDNSTGSLAVAEIQAAVDMSAKNLDLATTLFSDEGRVILGEVNDGRA
jgi:hypothetical protein